MRCRIEHDFDDFPKISDHFPKMSEDFPKLFRRKDERFWTFFGHFPKISEEGPMMFRSYNNNNTSKYFLRDYVAITMVIILVTMATRISSQVNDKNNIFTACDDDMIFGVLCSAYRPLSQRQILCVSQCVSQWITLRTRWHVTDLQE